MPAMSKKQADFLREVYFPAIYYKEVLAQTLKEVEGEMEQQQALDSLVLKAEANVARLAETYRERAMTPGQVMSLKEAQRTVKSYQDALGQQAAGQRAFVANPGAAQIEALRQFRAGTTESGEPPDSEVARKALELAEKRASAISNPAVARKAYLDIIAKANLGKVGVDEVNRSVRRTFGDGVTLAKVKAQAAKDGPALRAAAEASVEPDQTPLDVEKAEMLIEEVEAKGDKWGGKGDSLSPSEKAMTDLFIEKLRDPNSPGRAHPDEFDSPEEYEAALAAYNKTLRERAYGAADAEWFAADYLQALATAHDLRARQEAGPGYDDPYKEAQRRAFERGGYTVEEVALMKYRGTPMEKYVRPAYARAREDIEPKSDIEKVIKEVYDQSGGKVSLSQIQALLDKKRQQEMTTTRQTTKGDREGRRRQKKLVRSIYSPEAMEQAESYLIALRLRASGVGAEGDEPDRIVAPAVPQSKVPDAATAAEVQAAQAKRAAKEAVEEAEAPPAEEAVDVSGDEIDLSGGGVITAEEALAEEAPAEEFVTDPTNPDYAYRKTSKGDYMYSYKGFPVGVARKGSRAHQSIESVLGGGKPLPPVQRAPAAPVVPPGATPEGAALVREQQRQALEHNYPNPLLDRARAAQQEPAPAAPAPALLTAEELEALYGGQ